MYTKAYYYFASYVKKDKEQGKVFLIILGVIFTMSTVAMNALLEAVP